MKDFLPPGSTIGVLGGGPLGRMLTIAARRMGYRVISWIGGPDTGPAGLADEVIEEPFDSSEALTQFLEKADVATVEFENIPLPLLESIEQALPLFPGSKAIATCQHRQREKAFLSQNHFPCAPFHVIDSAEALATALLELPASGGILKTAEFGYDGKGQLPVTSEDDAEQVWRRFQAPRAVLEEKIELAGELSVLVVRDQQHNVVTYDPVENIHRDHILDISRVPAHFSRETLQQARQVATGIAESLDYVGILAVEFFLSEDDDLLVNEMAPRPHNSGHHTLDACATSQFEQQLRCLIGASPGETRLHSPTMMLNLLGDIWDDADGSPPWDEVLALPGSHLHLYGKAEARPGRKMGHATFTGTDADEVLEVQTRARRLLHLPRLPEH